jgi:hypothetical protein
MQRGARLLLLVQLPMLALLVLLAILSLLLLLLLLLLLRFVHAQAEPWPCRSSRALCNDCMLLLLLPQPARLWQEAVPCR